MKNTIKLTTMITGVKRLCVLLILAKPVYVNAQASVHISPAVDEKSAIAKIITTFFDGFSLGDTNMVKDVIDKNMTLQTIIDQAEQPVKVKPEAWSKFLKSIAAPHKQKFEERIVNWDIRVDGAYANAWCKYKVILSDTVFHHWGIDNFQLVKDGGKWRILSVTDTRRMPNSYVEETATDVVSRSASLPALKTREELSLQINDLLNRWHKAAATADEIIFFHSMDSSCVYLGTDKTEHWSKQDFEVWSKKYFDKDKAWDFTPYGRHIYFADGNAFAWFDELLNTQMGVCRGSGVVKYENGNYRLMHYNLAVTVPNEKMKEFVKINK